MLQSLIKLKYQLLTEIPFICLAICSAQFTATVVSSPLGDGSDGFPVSSALNLSCVIMPTPTSDDTVEYAWIENCDAIPQCFVDGQTTVTVSTSRLRAEDSGSYQCQPTINGMVITSNEFTVRITGKYSYCIAIHTYTYIASILCSW